MSVYDAADHERSCRVLCPIDIGSDHAIGWSPEGNIYWLHKCDGDSYRGDQPWRWSVGTIDVTSGERHELRKRLPVYVGGSVLCGACGDHGFINDERWVEA